MRKKSIVSIAALLLGLTSGAVSADHVQGHDPVARLGVVVTNQRLNTEISDRTAADAVLQSNIDAEAAARAAADGILQSNIDAEAATRAAADSGLQSQIGAETSERITGDQDLQTQIDGISAAKPFNPLQVALLRWYEANESGIAFPVGTNPFGIAFDGANIWVANENDSTVSKL